MRSCAPIHCCFTTMACVLRDDTASRYRRGVLGKRNSADADAEAPPVTFEISQVMPRAKRLQWYGAIGQHVYSPDNRPSVPLRSNGFPPAFAAKPAKRRKNGTAGRLPTLAPIKRPFPAGAQDCCCCLDVRHTGGNKPRYGPKTKTYCDQLRTMTSLRLDA